MQEPISIQNKLLFTIDFARGGVAELDISYMDFNILTNDWRLKIEEASRTYYYNMQFLLHLCLLLATFHYIER